MLPALCSKVSYKMFLNPIVGCLEMLHKMWDGSTVLGCVFIWHYQTCSKHYHYC